jgi:predicted ribosomally synthesized peptide with nif11-like leader
MNPNTIEAFIELARRDAAVQEQVAAALNHTDPVHALTEVARSAGFSFTAAELTASLGGPISDGALDAVVGGLSSPVEWFAETFRRSGRPGQVEPN